MPRNALRSVGLTALALLTLSLAPNPAGADTDEFKRLFASQNSWEKATAIKTLDPNDKKAYKILEKLLETQDWYLREACIDVLSGALTGDVAEEMHKELKKGKGYVAEGIALAIGKSGDNSKVPWLVEALEAKDWRVRRSAAVALKELPDKRAVEPLIEAWKTELKDEKEFRVWVRCVEALEEISGEDLDTISDWENWWAGVKDSFVIGGKKKEASKSSTVVRGVELDYETRGDGGPLLVIPDYGFEKSYLKTYLRNLEEFNQIIYVELPGAANFKPALPPEPGLPYPKYPLEKISAAFEQLVKDLAEKGTIKSDKINLFCHGMSGWIGMTFAAKFPASVRRLVLCAPYSSGDAWGKGNDRLVNTGRTQGDLEKEHFALSRILEGGTAKYSASSAQESDALRRKGFSIYFADQRDSEIGTILGPKVMKEVDGSPAGEDFEVFRPMGGVIIPSDFKLFALPKVPVPTLVMVGKHATMTSEEDAGAIAKHYPKSSVVVFTKSSRMPFIEENSKFVKFMNKFIN